MSREAHAVMEALAGFRVGDYVRTYAWGEGGQENPVYRVGQITLGPFGSAPTWEVTLGGYQVMRFQDSLEHAYEK